VVVASRQDQAAAKVGEQTEGGLGGLRSGWLAAKVEVTMWCSYPPAVHLEYAETAILEANKNWVSWLNQSPFCGTAVR
jgi:hypothetical protein